ncbi:MAG: bifunctional DNA-formamidopyrimidine glycosylase/DNA-(apurinic or apyrimidinic site) lyase [Arachnia sp.]
MPELPEVESVRRGLDDHATGRRIDHVAVRHPRAVRNHLSGPEGFVREVTGGHIDQVRRRGKFLWLVLADDALVAHLGMSGQFRIHDPDEPVAAHTRLVFTMDDERELRFIDQRMFGGLALVRDAAANPVPHIAPDPFDPDFCLPEVARGLRSRHTGVKRAILDQSLVSGIGNIYADETLWRARLHFEHPTQRLSQQQAEEVLGHARDVMAEALDVGGTSFDSLYVNINGASGYFARSLDAYGREAEPCRRCHTPLVRARFTNRSSYLCPQCQRQPRGRRRA